MTIHQFTCVVDDCGWVRQEAFGSIGFGHAPFVATPYRERAALAEKELLDHLATHPVEQFVKTIVRLQKAVLDNAIRPEWGSKMVFFQEKPTSPWFTPAEFPIETAERADRERMDTRSLADWREVLRQHLLERRPIAFGGNHALTRVYEWPEAEPLTPAEADEALGLDAATVRLPGGPVALGCEAHFRGGCANCGGTEEGP